MDGCVLRCGGVIDTFYFYLKMEPSHLTKKSIKEPVSVITSQFIHRLTHERMKKLFLRAI